MKNIKIYQIDAFTDKMFHGNPAAVCLLEDWLNDELLQAIAFENNLSETAFVKEDPNGYCIRWFTPNGEINLCGHATLAAGFLLFELGKFRGDKLSFSSLSGPLEVSKQGERLTLNFPKATYEASPHPELLVELTNQPVLEAFVSTLDYLLLLPDTKTVSLAEVDFRALAKLPNRGLILTAKSHEVDFYSRCFYPKHNIPEDPVTGSAYCVLAPFWADRLNKTTLRAIQGSTRQGEVFCEVAPDRIYISGCCKWYLKGHLVI